MKSSRLLIVLAVLLSLPTPGPAQKAQLPPPTEKPVYKTAGGTPLQIWIWKPQDWKEGDRRSAIVFYHGGGWSGGSPTAFSRQCAKLAGQGMVACSVQYRLTSQPGVTMDDCVKDARSAFRWVTGHAAVLGVDPAKIAAGGGSAGGHLAATLTTLDELNDAADDLAIPIRPAALVLFNPAVNLDIPAARRAGGNVAREEILRLSPFHHLKAPAPPVIVFHGSADTTVPLASVQEYAVKVREFGVTAEVSVFEGRGHAFFNKEPDVWETLQQAEAFLRKQNLLK